MHLQKEMETPKPVRKLLPDNPIDEPEFRQSRRQHTYQELTLLLQRDLFRHVDE